MGKTVEKSIAYIIGLTACFVVFAAGMVTIYFAYHIADLETTTSILLTIGLAILGILLMGKSIAALGRLGWAIEELGRER